MRNGIEGLLWTPKPSNDEHLDGGGQLAISRLFGISSQPLGAGPLLPPDRAGLGRVAARPRTNFRIRLSEVPHSDEIIGCVYFDHWRIPFRLVVNIGPDIVSSVGRVAAANPENEPFREGVRDADPSGRNPAVLPFRQTLSRSPGYGRADGRVPGGVERGVGRRRPDSGGHDPPTAVRGTGRIADDAGGC